MSELVVSEVDSSPLMILFKTRKTLITSYFFHIFSSKSYVALMGQPLKSLASNTHTVVLAFSYNKFSILNLLCEEFELILKSESDFD